MASTTIIELSEIFSDAVLVLELTGLFLVSGNVFFFGGGGWGGGILRPRSNVELFIYETNQTWRVHEKFDVCTQLSSSERVWMTSSRILSVCFR